jgi:integrase/recombinase XerD
MELIVEYINYLESNNVLSANSLRLYKRDLLDFDKFWNDKFENDDFKELSGAHLDKFRIWVLNAGASTASVNRKLTALRGLWNWLREQGTVERDPFVEIVRASQFRNKEASILSSEDIAKLLDCEDLDLKSKMILELMYATGIRIGELTKLTLPDIDIDSQLITIAKNGRTKERVVPFNNLAKEYIAEYIEENGLSDNNALLLNKQGEPVSEREIFRLVREAAKKAGLDCKLSPSIIRNSFVKHMLENGAHEVLVKDLIGQKTLC